MKFDYKRFKECLLPTKETSIQDNMCLCKEFILVARRLRLCL